MRPLWSIMIPAYNCSAFLPMTLDSVIREVAGREDVQVEVIDDCSLDGDMEQIVRDRGKGKIGYYRQDSNRGSLRNFECCLLRSKGSLIHLLHGDDLILPGFYDKMQVLFKNFPQAGAAFCRHQYIDENNNVLYLSDSEKAEDGILANWLTHLYERQRIQPPSIVVKRAVYENLGSFFAVEYGEDWEMWLRIAAHFAFAYTPEPLAAYRQHSGSISGRSFLNGQNIRDLKKVMDLAEKYLPTSQRKMLHRKTRKFYAGYALRTGRMLWHNYQDRQAAQSQIREALDLRNTAWMRRDFWKLKIKMALNIP